MGLFAWVFDPLLDAPQAAAVSISVVALVSAAIGYLYRRSVWIAAVYAAVTAGLSLGAFFLFVVTVITVECWGVDDCL
jgi:hypothetical protein